jgi:hypothetical protein
VTNSEIQSIDLNLISLWFTFDLPYGHLMVTLSTYMGRVSDLDFLVKVFLKGFTLDFYIRRFTFTRPPDILFLYYYKFLIINLLLQISSSKYLYYKYGHANILTGLSYLYNLLFSTFPSERDQSRDILLYPL